MGSIQNGGDFFRSDSRLARLAAEIHFDQRMDVAEKVARARELRRDARNRRCGSARTRSRRSLLCWFADGRSDAIECQSGPPARPASRLPPARSSRRNRARPLPMRPESPRSAASCSRARAELTRRRAPPCMRPRRSVLARSPAALRVRGQSTYWLSVFHCFTPCRASAAITRSVGRPITLSRDPSTCEMNPPPTPWIP